MHLFSTECGPPAPWSLKGRSHYSSGDGGRGKRQRCVSKQDSQLSAVITMLECADRLADWDFICSATQGHDDRQAILRRRLGEDHRLETGLTGLLLFEGWH